MTMLELLSARRKSLLLSFSTMKKLAFVILLYERMLPELRSYFLASGRDFTVIQAASERFWQLLSGDETFASWNELREKILDSLPDSEVDGSLAGQFALNAGLVAADIAGFAEDGENTHVIEAIEYARDSIHAKAASEMRTFVYDPTVEEAISRHPLVHRESQREEEDVTFLDSFPEAPWPRNVVSILRDRAQAQDSLLSTIR
jgi:uncharacterized protein YjaG (DUF416 family)